MRTRRSWRNQDRLWRALGGPQPPAPPRREPDRCRRCQRVLTGHRESKVGECTNLPVCAKRQADRAKVAAVLAAERARS